MYNCTKVLFIHTDLHPFVASSFLFHIHWYFVDEEREFSGISFIYKLRRGLFQEFITLLHFIMHAIVTGKNLQNLLLLVRVSLLYKFIILPGLSFLCALCSSSKEKTFFRGRCYISESTSLNHVPKTILKVSHVALVGSSFIFFIHFQQFPSRSTYTFFSTLETH